MLARTVVVVVIPRVGLDVSYVCVVMWQLGERLSMTDGSTMQTSFQYDIAHKKGFISSDRGGGGLSMHGMCNRLRRTQALLVGGSSHKPPVSHTLPVDVGSCTLPLHQYMTFSQKKVGTPHVRQGGKHNPFSKQTDTQVSQSYPSSNHR